MGVKFASLPEQSVKVRVLIEETVGGSYSIGEVAQVSVTATAKNRRNG